MKIKVGDKAPEFTLPSQDGTQVSLSEFRGKKNVVLYFYPKDDTPGCKMQACGFRDKYPIFANARTEIIGISQDSQQSHKQFATKYNLPFTLLCDATNKVRQLYDVPPTLYLRKLLFPISCLFLFLYNYKVFLCPFPTPTESTSSH